MDRSSSIVVLVVHVALLARPVSTQIASVERPPNWEAFYLADVIAEPFLHIGVLHGYNAPLRTEVT